MLAQPGMVLGNSSGTVELDAEVFVKQLWLQVRKRIKLAERMGNIDTQCNLNALHRIHHQHSELLVKDVQGNRIMKGCPRDEAVQGNTCFSDLTGFHEVVVEWARYSTSFTECIPVPTQPVITNSLQMLQGKVGVSHKQTSGYE